MNRQATPHPVWSTSSLGCAADTSAMELLVLGDHLDRCQDARGRLFTLRCVGDTMNTFVAARFVTSVVVVTLLIGAGSLVL